MWISRVALREQLFFLFKKSYILKKRDIFLKTDVFFLHNDSNTGSVVTAISQIFPKLKQQLWLDTQLP